MFYTRMRSEDAENARANASEAFARGAFDDDNDAFAY